VLPWQKNKNEKVQAKSDMHVGPHVVIASAWHQRMNNLTNKKYGTCKMGTSTLRVLSIHLVQQKIIVQPSGRFAGSTIDMQNCANAASDASPGACCHDDFSR
jgi:hypothetical protein